MKNPHGVEPTRYMKKEESKYAIGCDSDCGPKFSNGRGCDICIRDHCNRENSCSIDNDGTHAYGCHPKYKSSLFVNTAVPNEGNEFSVLDYEVYTHN